VLAGGPAKIARHFFSSVQFDYQIPEQALVVDTRDGLVVITGCSHPGIVDMLRAIKTAFAKNVSMVVGGSHLPDKTEAEMMAAVADLKSLGVATCGATHCTGGRRTRRYVMPMSFTPPLNSASTDRPSTRTTSWPTALSPLRATMRKPTSVQDSTTAGTGSGITACASARTPAPSSTPARHATATRPRMGTSRPGLTAGAPGRTGRGAAGAASA
jgi:hypothetical protein